MLDGELVKRDNGSFASFSQEFDSLILHQKYVGDWLSLVEHCVWDARVVGSNPTSPTIIGD